MLLLLLSANAGAQRPPIRAYTTEDGLASDIVRRLVRDPNGFLWLCTTNGLSRFDGERFTTYTPETGLPHASINDLLVTHRGRYLLATNGGGVVAFDVSSAPSAADASSRRRTSEPRPDAWRFRAYRVGTQAATNRVNLFMQDRRGRIWVGTDGGLFVLERWREPFRFVRVPLLLATPDSSVQVWAFAEDREGSLWIGTGVGLTRRLPDGRLVHYEWSTSRGRMLGLAYARNGILWVGHDGGVTAIVPEPVSSLEIGKGAA
ncbi:MAG: ligand-binding sensor domain-containing protein [Vicinamibacteraceae bacterium]